jgi:hypothetical protein
MGSLKTIQRSGSRFYVHPDSKEKVPGVTSVVGMLPKPFLQHWASKVTAELAVECIGELVGLAIRDKQGAIDWLKGAPRRSTSAAADVGTEVHEYFERLARGDKLGRVHPEVQPFVNHINEFHDRYQPRYLFIEDAVWSVTHGYAGSFDAIAEIEGEIVIIDAKTTRSGVHEEVALQLSAYSHADHIIDQNGDEQPLPAITAGAVLHLRPEGWKFVPVRQDDEVFSYFLTLRRVFDWVNGAAETVIGKPDYESTASTGAERRASRR